MGVFNIANQWSMALLFIPQRICLVVFPVLSSLITEAQLERYRKTLKLTVLLNACISLIPACFIILLSKYIIQFYGSDFETGVETLSLMALCAVVASVTMIGDRALASRGRVWQRFFAQAISSAVLLVTAHIFISGDGGAEGLARAFFLSGCLHIMIVFGFMTRFPSNEKKQPLLKDSTGIEAGKCDGRCKV